MAKARWPWSARQFDGRNSLDDLDDFVSHGATAG